MLLAGCGLRDVLPGPPVATGAARAAYDRAEAPRTADGAALTYLSAPSVPWPVLPIQVWGLRYALDIVLVSDHPDWVMHEYARVDVPGRSVWLAKDAGIDREQTITADLDDLASWVPEVPVRRRQRALVVTDVGTATHADLRFQYQNPLGQGTDVHYTGPLPTAPSQPRNGNTMGHSRASVAALLDLYRFRIGGSAQISIAGVERKLHRLANLVPEAYLLAQVQGGFAVADFCQGGDASGFVLKRPCAADDWPTEAEERWSVAQDGWVVRDGPVVSLRYHFVGGELDRAQAVQNGEGSPLVNVTFSPRLPDVRRRFDGDAHGAFVVDINGQPGHGVGRTLARWEGDAVVLSVMPTAPRWFADRPLESRITYAHDVSWVRTTR